jgi:hypothetical protein
MGKEAIVFSPHSRLSRKGRGDLIIKFKFFLSALTREERKRGINVIPPSLPFLPREGDLYQP